VHGGQSAAFAMIPHAQQASEDARAVLEHV
jgi:hypothetical protein